MNDLLIQQAQALLDALQHILKRMDPDDDSPEGPYNDFYREQIEDLIGKAQDRLERRQGKANAAPCSRDAPPLPA